jgi:membrane protease YdiL (CAAX protease family)
MIGTADLQPHFYSEKEFIFMKKKEKKYIAPNEASLIRWIIALVASIGIGVVIGRILFKFMKSTPSSIMGTEMEQIKLILAFVCLFAGLVIAIKLVGKTSMKDFILGVGGKVNKKECLILLVLYMIGYAAILLMARESITLRHVKASEFAFLFIFMLLTAWSQTTWEELIFRGILLRWACKNNIRFTKKSVIIAVITSAAFALAHAGNPEVTSQSGIRMVMAVATYAIPGMVYFIADLHFGSLLPGIIIHWINNFLAFTLVGSDAGAMPLPTLFVSGGSFTAEGMLLSNTVSYLPIMVYIILDAWKKKKAAATC